MTLGSEKLSHSFEALADSYFSPALLGLSWEALVPGCAIYVGPGLPGGVACTGWQDGLCKLWVATETGITYLFSLAEEETEAERVRALAKVTMLRSGRHRKLLAQILCLHIRYYFRHPTHCLGTSAGQILVNALAKKKKNGKGLISLCGWMELSLWLLL